MPPGCHSAPHFTSATKSPQSYWNHSSSPPHARAAISSNEFNRVPNFSSRAWATYQHGVARGLGRPSTNTTRTLRWLHSRYAEPFRGTRHRGAIGSARRLRKDPISINHLFGGCRNEYYGVSVSRGIEAERDKAACLAVRPKTTSKCQLSTLRG